MDKHHGGEQRVPSRQLPTDSSWWWDGRRWRATRPGPAHRQHTSTWASVSAAFGSWALGIVVAYFAWYFVVRLDSFSITGLAALLTLLLGGTVAVFLSRHVNVGGSVGFALYSIGLLCGSLAYLVAYVVVHGGPSA